MFSYSNENKVNTRLSECTNNETVDFDFLINNTLSNQNKSTILEIRKIAKNGFDNNVDLERLKKDLRHLKLKLSYFLFSGICERHHSDKTLDYNSFIQLDIDFKYRNGDYYSKLTKWKLARYDFVAMAAFSPTGYGVRVLVKTSNYDKSKHLEASKQVIEYISKDLNIDIKNFDFLGASQPSFETYDDELYFTKDFTDFKVNVKEFSKSELSKYECDIRATDKTVFDIAKRFAIGRTGNGFEDGNKHLFVNRFSMACNMLGVSFQVAKEHILTNYYNPNFANDKSNAISSPYFSYKDVFGLWSYKVMELNQSFNVVFNSPFGSKLSDVLEKNNVKNLRNCNIISGTGTGKTFWISLLGDEKQKRIIVVPNVQMVMQVWKAKGYPYNATPFCGKAKGDVLNSDFIVVTYDSLYRLAAILENKGIASEYICYLDEFHNLTTSTSREYKLNASNFAIDCLSKFKAWVGVTGTDIYNFHPRFKGVKKYIVNIPKQEKKLTLIDAKEPLKTLSECVKSSINRGRFPLVLYNNTGSGLDAVKRLLKDVPNMAYFNSKEKENQFFRELTSNSEIHPNIKGIVSTTVIKEGNDINNEYNFDIIIYGNFHPTEIEQFANRPRYSKDISVCIIRTEKKDENLKLYDNEKVGDKDYQFNPYRFASFVEGLCDTRILELSNEDTYCYEQELLLEMRACNYVEYLPLRKYNGKVEIDWLNFNYLVFRNETKFINRHDKHLIEYLSKFNIIFDKKLTAKDEIDSYVKAELKKQKKAVKLSKKKEYEQVVSDISNSKDLMQDIKAFELESGNRSSIEKMAYKRYIKLRDNYIPHESIVEMLQDVGTSKARFSTIIKQLVIYQLKKSDEYIKSNRRFSIVLQAVYAYFKDGETLSVETIKERLKNALKIDKSFDVSKFDNDNRNDKTLKTARLFFDLDKIRVRNGKERHYEYKVKDLNFDIDFDDRFWNMHYSDEYLEQIANEVVMV